jgi:CDP-glycerol glycerophosphotransferase (TagB/SpsB family)
MVPAQVKKTIFLQHGITKDAVKFRGKLDAIMACSEQEKELIKSANTRYKDKIYTVGFCRYDHLKNLADKENPKIILVMPTFRKWLRDIGRLQNADKAFKETTYFKKWNSFLNSEELQKSLNQNHMQLIFFPHKEMQGLAHNFKTKNSHIKIGKPGEYDIQDLLKRSSILITDYSSVLFDFVYMNKPVIFYQFDQADFFSKHYPSSGKAYPFGDIFTNEQALIDELIKTIRRNCIIKDNYAKDIKGFFKYRDQHNCERNFKTIKGLK